MCPGATSTTGTEWHPATQLSSPACRIPEANFSELQDCAEEVSLKHLLWSSLDAWADFTERVAGQPLRQLDIAALEAAVAQYTRTGQRVEKGLSLNRVSIIDGL